MSNELNTDPMDFDDILPHVGEFGRYQKWLFMAMAPFCFNLVLIYFPHIFITLEPQHWCKVPQMQVVPADQRRQFISPPSTDMAGKLDGCLMYDVDYNSVASSYLAGNHTLPHPDTPTIQCTDWEYDFSAVGGYPSIVSELNWVCSRGDFAATAQSIFFVGAIVGGLLVGGLADRFGRIPVLVATNVIGAVSCLLTATVSSFAEYAVYKFLAGLAFDNIFVMMYVLALEYFAPQHRTLVANMSIAIFYTLGTVLVPWFAIWVSDWRLFSVLCAVPMMFGAMAYFLVPESVRWLMSQGRTAESIKIVKKIAYVNRKIIPDEVLKKFEMSINGSYSSSSSGSPDEVAAAEEEMKNASLLGLLKTPAQLRTVILVALFWMLVSLCYDGHLRNVANLPLDIFITFTVACATELPADTILTLTLDRWGRRWYAFGSMFMSGVFSLLVVVVPLDHVLTIATLAIMGRFFVNIAFNIGLQYTAEILPTVIRAQGVSAVHIAGYVAALISPQIVLLGRQSPMTPLIVLGGLSVVAGCLALFLPETLHADLPQTLQEGELFCRNFQFWSFPCIDKAPAPPPATPSPRASFIRPRPLLRGESYRSSVLRQRRKETIYLPPPS
uniref:Organic cation transporter protein-like n=1 Tax=Hirondellea gigas TaxID=1518452 RepID=A0A6A7FYK0_9CRUS